MEEIRIGDKVRVINEDNSGRIPNGKVLKVVGIDLPYLNVEFDDGTTGLYFKYRFEKVYGSDIDMEEANRLIEEMLSNENNINNVEEDVMNVSVLEQKQNDVLKVVNEWKKNDCEYEIEMLEENLESVRRYIRDYRNELIKRYQREKEFMRKLQDAKARESETYDFTSDIKAIYEHPSVDMVKADGKMLYIHTDYIKIYDDEGNTFAGNKYRLEFDYKDMNCKIFGLDEDYNRVSYWANDRGRGTEYLDPHPHVNGRNGSACWGSAGDMLLYNMNNYELYASYLVVFNFLQQVNLDDPAGKYIRNWDCIDENDDVIENPYEVEMYSCHICNHEMEEGDDDLYSCDCCDAYMCSDHYRWVESEHEYVCDECFDEHYFTCEDCNEYFYNEKHNECKECGNSFCDDCVTHINGETYCNNCYEEKFTVCDQCGHTYKNEEIITCFDCGTRSCKECGEFETYNGEHYCGDCYDENFAACYECGEVMEKPDTFHCDLCEERYCYNCREEHEVGANVVCSNCKEEEEVTNE